MVRSIPINLLFHNVVYYKRLGKNDYEEITYADPVSIKRVRIDPSSKIIKRNQGDEEQLNALLFYDSVKSVPLNIDFVENDKIEFEGKTYLIAIVEKLYDNSKLHHLEIGLK